MLELPEVITLSKQVNNALSGKTITQVFNATKPHKFTFYNGNPSEYGKLLVGKTILSSEGYGMFVNFNLSDNVIMNIGDGVSVRYYSAGDEIPANYQLLLTFMMIHSLSSRLQCMVLSMFILIAISTISTIN